MTWTLKIQLDRSKFFRGGGFFSHDLRDTLWLKPMQGERGVAASEQVVRRLSGTRASTQL